MFPNPSKFPPKEVLDTFYNEVATPRSDPKLAKLRSLVVDEILRGVEKRDSRFRGEVVDMGSHASGVSTKVSRELDILLSLNIDGIVEEYTSSPGLAKYRLTDSSSALWRDASERGYLQTRKVIEIFQKYVRQVVSSLTSDKGEGVTVGGDDTAATTITSTFRSSVKYKADLVVAVKCRGWPSSANAPWLQPGYSEEWPNQETINTIKQKGYDLVAKYVNEYKPGVTVHEMDLLWSFSMARAETILLKKIDDEGLCHKQLLVIMKAIRLYYLATTFGKPEPDRTVLITSYHLKVMLFQLRQKQPNHGLWTGDKLPERFTSFVSNFAFGLEIGLLPSFFFPNVNLYRGHGGMKKLFSLLCINPTAYIRSIEFDKQLKSMDAYQ